MNTNDKKIKFKKVSLRAMLEVMVEEVMTASTGNDEPIRFYWKDGDGELHEIIECDLLRGRFITDNQDFSEFDWELEDSHIYMKA